MVRFVDKVETRVPSVNQWADTDKIALGRAISRPTSDQRWEKVLFSIAFMALPVLAHRVLPSPEAKMKGVTAERILVAVMRKICKTFPGVKALHDVDFTLRKGEIHALMGENGAGKSTLIKVLTGVYQKDSGHIDIGDLHDIAIRSPQEAQNLGISTVYQEITLCPNLTVAENMFIGRDHGAFVHWKPMRSGIRARL